MPNSEQQFLELIDRHFPNRHKNFALPRGDDCAVFSSKHPVAVSTDIFAEDIHFRLSYFSAADIGHKALAVNLSDLAAMGARPLAFSFGLTLPTNISLPFWEEMFAQMSCLAREHSVFLCGGDLSRGNKLSLDITVFGECIHPPISRKKCREGDFIFLIGEPGLARLGFTALENNITLFPSAIKAHLRPRPLIRIGELVARKGLVTSLMDLSDGLAADLPRLLPDNLGASLNLKPNQIHPEIISYARDQNLSAANFAIKGGEEYALLGTVTPDRLADLQTDIAILDQNTNIKTRLIVLGNITPEKGILVNGDPLISSGFDHFSTNK